MRKYKKKPYRIKKKKSVLKNRFFWLGVLFLCLLVFLSYFLFFSDTYQVKKIIITGEQKVSEEEFRLLIEKKLENKILFWKTKSIFLFNLEEIRKDILDNFPQTAEIQIRREIPDTISILVRERAGVANWCQEEHCFLLDIDGVIFEENSSNPELIKIMDRQKLPPFILGTKVIEKDFLSKILEVERKLKTDFNLLLQEISLVSEERLNIKTAEGWEIFLNPQGDIGWQITKLSTVLAEEIPPENRDNLDYIELRFGNFAPYKYK